MADDQRAFWNERFSGDDYLFGTEPNAFLATQRERLKPGMRTLAVADGEGRNGVWLARQGLDVLSIDFSPVALAKAEKLAAAAGVTLKTECVDLAHWEWGVPRFDVVAAIFIQFADPAWRGRIFANIKHVLVPGGLLLLEGYRPKQLEYGTGGPSQVENLYTRDLLEREFADMNILHLAEYDTEVSEGSRHKGMSALIDLVAKKR
ncbi:SAM-dependent methyltransferase [Rhizomicrobium electricum]|uniref:Class I SAM-dependent methyltransferase n=1 Tax=Rhizomicrobium electricum TaxID=480070 RepID=A0ABP3P374_9PROT|nr:class I SAM-dependent methyltransferase [Rhizomicrobium electricum]NIJ47381.1 SAM-dependent methyltransferase [Rhizomicrobium electricum]